MEKHWYRLINNAMYGKVMENLKIRTNVKLVNNEKDYLKFAPKPICHTKYWQ